MKASNEKEKAQFETTVDLVLSSGKNRSLVVLAHDTDSDNASEVSRDIGFMDTYAKNNGVKIEYHVKPVQNKKGS